MPYIKQEHRERWQGVMREFRGVLQSHKDDISVGDINYILTSLLNQYLLSIKVNYEKLNGVMGVLASIKHEFYRRVIAPYEDKKKEKNGEVFDGII
jgi:hypothetical protein